MTKPRAKTRFRAGARETFATLSPDQRQDVLMSGVLGPVLAGHAVARDSMKCPEGYKRACRALEIASDACEWCVRGENKPWPVEFFGAFPSECPPGTWGCTAKRQHASACRICGPTKRHKARKASQSCL